MSEDTSYRQVVAWLVALNGPQKGRDFPLRVGDNVIGSSPECEVVLGGEMMSPRHALIRCFRDDTFQIFDLGAPSGTVLCSQSVSHAELINCDRLELGTVVLKFKSIY